MSEKQEALPAVSPLFYLWIVIGFATGFFVEFYPLKPKGRYYSGTILFFAIPPFIYGIARALQYGVIGGKGREVYRSKQPGFYWALVSFYILFIVGMTTISVLELLGYLPDRK